LSGRGSGTGAIKAPWSVRHRGERGWNGIPDPLSRGPLPRIVTLKPGLAKCTVDGGPCRRSGTQLLVDWYVMSFLLLAAVVFAVNLLPAFGPPTWAVLVFFRLQSSLPAVPLVLIGALAAASGRLVLATVSRRLRHHLSKQRVEHLEAARDAILGGRKRAVAGLGLFALSPLPSAQLFVAAGLVAAPLVPLTAAFFTGRLVSYSIYVGAASAAKHSLGSILRDSFTSPAGIAVQVVMLVGLVALLRVDWARILTRGRPTGRDGRNGGREKSAPASPTSVNRVAP
jgi:membrane protein YqaA with SNARE-associated domain